MRLQSALDSRTRDSVTSASFFAILEDVIQTKNLLQMSAAMFVPNGLLASSSSSQVHHSEGLEPLPTKLKFVPNGLLGASRTADNTNETEPSRDTETQVPLASMLIGSQMLLCSQPTHFGHSIEKPFFY